MRRFIASTFMIMVEQHWPSIRLFGPILSGMLWPRFGHDSRHGAS
jgi:hypothetical protein